LLDQQQLFLGPGLTNPAPWYADGGAIELPLGADCVGKVQNPQPAANLCWDGNN
jgi:hypothetical protein